ncbi:phosphoethanolamine--lipid A transferase EptA [Tenacibaculum sp. SDUM215027]|uniref:phosphoethanolamine--lipid A transferase EptA n=1 Tax=Tenacibaculum sp. SDUM215027 TaxID=3422596 RepID=UPI003D31EB26
MLVDLKNISNLFRIPNDVKKVLLVSILNLILFHYPLYRFTISKLDTSNPKNIFFVASLTVFTLVFNFIVFYLLLFLFRTVGKWLLILVFNISAIAVYFINNYGVVLNRGMISNVFNSKLEEVNGFWSVSLFVYILFLGIIPSVFIYKIKFADFKLKNFLTYLLVSTIILTSFTYANKSNWLWINRNLRSVRAIAMPWSYILNTARYYSHKNKESKKEILLPLGRSIKEGNKSVIVLVIGESARSKNFSLYGYEKNTNPLLSKIDEVYKFKANSSYTYTSEGVKSILSYKKSRELYEFLPSYLYRNDVDVFWRTTNWGEPKIKTNIYQKREDLVKLSSSQNPNYDEVLLSGLKEQIESSKKDKIFIVLHTYTSHGPEYYKKYPKKFNKFTPVCTEPALKKCDKVELVNAYDNTVLYTDYILSSLIKELKELKEYKSSMIYISDHGESLGEEGLYMHGLPNSMAPKEQFEIPFIVWTSSAKIKENKENEVLSQYYIFHSVLDFFNISSPIYDRDKSIFQK